MSETLPPDPHHPIDHAEVGRRVRAHVRDLIEKLADCDVDRPPCSEHGTAVHHLDDCDECGAITACLRRLANLPEPRGDAVKMLIEKTVARAMAEAFGDAGIDSVSLAAIWLDGFARGVVEEHALVDPLRERGQRTQVDAAEIDRCVFAELERLGIDRIVTTEFPSTIGTSNDAAAAGALVVKLVAIGASGVPIHGFEIKRNMIAVRSTRPLTIDEHSRISAAFIGHRIAVRGVPTREAANV